MTKPRKRLGEILIEAGMVDEYQVNAALTEQKRWGGKLGEHLVRLGYVTEDIILDILRNHLQMPTVDLLKVKIEPDVLKLVPKELVYKHQALPVGVKNIKGKDHLVIAMADPSNLDMLDELQFSTSFKILPALAGPITLDRAIRYYYDQRGDLFSEGGDEKDPFAETSIRDRVDALEGSPTLDAETLLGKKEDPEPKDDIELLRAEVSALRNILIESNLIDRKIYVALVNQLKNKDKK